MKRGILAEQEDIVQREGGEDLQIGRRRLSGVQPLRLHAVVEVKQRLAHQSGVTAHGIGVLRLQAGVHAVLELLVVGAVHIGLQHAVFQRPHADVPELSHPGGGRIHKGLHGQRIAGLVKLRRKDRDRAIGGLHRQTNEAEGPHPEGLKAELAAVKRDRIGDARHLAAHIGTNRVRAGAAKFFKIGDLYLRALSSYKTEAGISVQDRSGVQQDLLLFSNWNLHAAFGKQRKRFSRTVEAAGKALLLLIEQRDLPLNNAEHGRHTHEAEGILRHPRFQDLGRVPEAAIKIGVFPMNRRPRGVKLFDHRAEKLGMLVGLQRIAVIQPDPPVGKAGGDCSYGISGAVQNVPLDSKPVTALTAHNAVDGRPLADLPFHRVRVVVQHLDAEGIVPFPQPGRHVHCLVILAIAIPLAGTGEHRLAVDPEPVAGVCSNVQRQRAALRQLLVTSKVRKASAQIAVVYLFFLDFSLGDPQPFRLFPHQNHLSLRISLPHQNHLSLRIRKYRLFVNALFCFFVSGFVLFFTKQSEKKPIRT